jgi:hypothetical protein
MNINRLKVLLLDWRVRICEEDFVDYITQMIHHLHF